MDAAKTSLVCTGNSASATQLETSRTLTIGNTGKAFDGSGDVSWSLSEIGAAAASHTHDYIPRRTGSVSLSSSGWYRIASTPILKTHGSFILSINRDFNNVNSESHTFAINYAFGTFNISEINSCINTRGITDIRIIWNSHATAAYLEIYYALSNANTVRYTILSKMENDCGWEFITPEAGACPDGYNAYGIQTNSGNGASYHRIEMKGNIEFTDSGTSFRGLTGKCSANDYWRVGGAGTAADNAGYMEIATADDATEPIYVRQYSGAFVTLKRTAVLLDANGNTSFPGSISEGGTALSSKYAASSHSHSYLPLSGGTLTGALTFANGTYNTVGDDVAIGDINVGGVLGILGKNGNTAIQLVNYGASTTTGSSVTGVRWTCTGNGTSTITGTTSGTFSGSLSGNASSATKLATARTLTIGSTGKAFNGTANVSWSLSEIGAAASSHTHSYLPLTGGTITADSNNSTYGKAAINIANKTSGSSTIFPAISFMQINVSDANLVMKNSYFYRKTGSSTTYSRIYDSGNNTVDTYDSAAIGTANVLSGNLALKFAFGGNNTVTGGYGSAAIGTQCKVKGHHAIATGDYSESNSWCTVAMGNQVVANGEGQTVFGHFNVSSTSGSTGGTTGHALIVGNGTSGTARSNAFRVTYAGLTYAKGAYSSTGADYAEYFEWEDGNPNNEDRRGLFVTFASGNKIRIANTDEYILGVVSGKPVIIGNTDDDEQWAQRFLKDEYGEFIKQQFKQEREVKVIDEETGEEKTEIITEDIEFYVENPDYDPSKEYVTREHRPEWSPIGMLGVLSVRDDGTCVVNGYCKCSDGGIATASEISTYSYRVIERVTDNIVKVVLK